MVGASEYVLVVFFVVLLTGTSLFANGWFLVVFCRYKRIRIVNNYLFLILTCANALVGLCYPLQCLVDVGILNSRLNCLPITCVLLLMGLIITWSIVALTIERYLIIIHPFTMHQILTKKRVLGIVGLIVSYALFGGAVVPAVLASKVSPDDPSMDSYANDTAVLLTECRIYNLVPSRAYRLFYLANRVMSIPFFIGIYLRIFLVARRHMRAIAVQVTQPTTQARPAPPDHCDSPERHPRARWRREIRLTLLVFTIALYQSLCWIPQTVLFFQNPVLPSIMYTLTHFFTYSSTAVYPVIYGLGNRDLREAMANLLGCGNQLNSPVDGGSRRTGTNPGEEGTSRRSACTVIAKNELRGTAQIYEEASSPTSD